MDLNHSAPRQSRVHASRWTLILAVFTAAVVTSALLLFAVQPMFARMVLPRLGGSPSVWSVAMVFFQTMLLAGYAYAHMLMRAVRPPIAIAVHIVLLITAGLMLPLSIASGWGDPPGNWALWLIGVFAASIGLPFFALAANNPLLQTWFVRTGHANGKDPYFTLRRLECRQLPGVAVLSVHFGTDAVAAPACCLMERRVLAAVRPDRGVRLSAAALSGAI
jgi:hypothetical protein